MLANINGLVFVCQNSRHLIYSTMLIITFVLCSQVKAVVLDPRNQFNVDRTLTNEDVRSLIEVMCYYGCHVKILRVLELAIRNKYD